MTAHPILVTIILKKILQAIIFEFHYDKLEYRVQMSRDSFCELNRESVLQFYFVNRSYVMNLNR